MNRIDRAFKGLKARKEKAFITYITAGDPSLAMTAKLVGSLEKAGVDLIELGIPFSDPLADGPVIQAASKRALDRGATLHKIFEMVRALRRKCAIPIVFMTYYNPVLRHGLAKFFADCRGCGVDGVIVPDLPCDEAKDLMRCAKREKVAAIFLAAPTSTTARLRTIVKNSAGFIYYVSLTGVTGARAKLPPEVISKVKTIKRMTKKPVCVGFGVSTPGQAMGIAKVADGVIVGSAIVRVIDNSPRGRLVKKVSSFSKRLADAVHKGEGGR
ncbi:MAG: tryptophan synthase subunit alpha [Candidatus Omnitrophica bacterium]|nr:tryptophan synthase subunit alpha [Candidatus Omnitrophota bacterium]